MSKTIILIIKRITYDNSKWFFSVNKGKEIWKRIVKYEKNVITADQKKYFKINIKENINFEVILSVLLIFFKLCFFY